jgi:hypothetical protein
VEVGLCLKTLWCGGWVVSQDIVVWRLGCVSRHCGVEVGLCLKTLWCGGWVVSQDTGVEVGLCLKTLWCGGWVVSKEDHNGNRNRPTTYVFVSILIFNAFG